MGTINEKVSQEFSKGNFAFAFDHFADDIVWDLVGATRTKGKEAVTAYCNKMLVEMAHSTLNNTSVIVSENVVAIEGYCDYVNENNAPGRIEYCDVYHFRAEKLEQIRSYCVEMKD